LRKEKKNIKKYLKISGNFTFLYRGKVSLLKKRKEKKEKRKEKKRKISQTT